MQEPYLVVTDDDSNKRPGGRGGLLAVVSLHSSVTFCSCSDVQKSPE